MDQQTRWQTKYEALNTFITREGHSRVPAEHIEKTASGTVLLGDWVSHQRSLQKRGILSPDREKLLAGLPTWEWGPLKRGPKRNEEKAQKIRELRRQGKSLAQIAYEVQLSRQRVHQILKKEGM